MRLKEAIAALAKAESGKGVIKFSLGTCLLAIAVATSSPAFEANPLLTGKILEIRKQLPDTLDKITRAMGG
jgi:Flp pilus assembly protein TadB